MLDRILLYRQSAEVNHADTHKWEAAFFDEWFPFKMNRYIVTLGLRDDPDISLHAVLEARDDLATNIAIPLMDPTSDAEMSAEAYAETKDESGFDSESFKKFCLDRYRVESLLAMHNRHTTGQDNENILDWVRTKFSFAHFQRYKDVYIGSEGSYSDGTRVWIQIEQQNPGIRGRFIGDVMNFARVIDRSMPHIELNPLSVEDYVAKTGSLLL